MNSNGQILGKVNEILDDIRSHKEKLESLKRCLKRIENSFSNVELTLMVDRSDKIEISTQLHGGFIERRIKHHYDTAIVFVKRGINEEIEFKKEVIKKLEIELENINLVHLIK